METVNNNYDITVIIEACKNLNKNINFVEKKKAFITLFRYFKYIDSLNERRKIKYIHALNQEEISKYLKDKYIQCIKMIENNKDQNKNILLTLFQRYKSTLK